MNPDDLAQLNEQIAAMAKAGLPLDTGLACLARDMGPSQLRRITRSLADDLRGGATLPQAIARHEGELPPFYAGLVEAGIRTGRLADVLRTLTLYARTITLTRWIVIESLLYPAVVLLLAVILFGSVVYFVVPMVAQPLADFRLQVPLATRMLVFISQHVLETLVLPIVMALILFLGVRWIARRTAAGRDWWAGVVYSVPLLGGIIRSARLAAFVELLAVMVEHSVPMPEAIQWAGQASSDPLLASQSRVIREQLEQGRPLGAILRDKGLLPEWVAWMTLAGERQGTLSATLHQVAENYRRQVEMRAAVLRNVLPPVFILITASIIGMSFLLSLALPLVMLLEGLSK